MTVQRMVILLGMVSCLGATPLFAGVMNPATQGFVQDLAGGPYTKGDPDFAWDQNSVISADFFDIYWYEYRGVVEFDISSLPQIASATFSITNDRQGLPGSYPHSYNFLAYTSSADGVVTLADWSPVGATPIGTREVNADGQVVTLDVTSQLQSALSAGANGFGITVDKVETLDGGNVFRDAQLDVEPVPEPTSLAIFSFSTLSLVASRVRRRRKRS